MPLKKPSPLSMPLERQGSFHMSDTGSFSQENFTISKNGITQSPLLQGEVTSLRLEQLDVGVQLGRGASAKVYLATHRPTSKMLALKVLDNDLEASLEHRRLLLNEVTPMHPRAERGAQSGVCGSSQASRPRLPTPRLGVPR